MEKNFFFPIFTSMIFYPIWKSNVGLCLDCVLLSNIGGKMGILTKVGYHATLVLCNIFSSGSNNGPNKFCSWDSQLILSQLISTNFNGIWGRVSYYQYEITIKNSSKNAQWFSRTSCLIEVGQFPCKPISTIDQKC